MRKPMIYVTKWNNMPYIDFCMVNGNKKIILFTMPYTKNVYDFFEKGKSVSYLRNMKRKGGRDPLSKIIERRIPYELNKLKKQGELTNEC